MEFVLFLLSNLCVDIGMLLVLLKLAFAISKGRVAAKAELKGLNISPDTIVLLSFGVLARVYWSCSPPVVWQHEATWIQVIAVVDIIFSVVIHFLLFSVSFVIRYGSDAFWGVEGNIRVRGAGLATDFKSLWNNFIIGVTRPRAIYEQALPLTAATLAISFAVSYMFMPGASHPHAWPGTDVMMVFNMTVDMVAMIPQLVLLAEGAAVSSSTAVTTHFVALLSVARVLRLGFWLAMFLMWGEIVWVFILPDVLHTLLMADFIWKYLSQMGRDFYGNRSLQM